MKIVILDNSKKQFIMQVIEPFSVEFPEIADCQFKHSLEVDPILNYVISPGREHLDIYETVKFESGIIVILKKTSDIIKLDDTFTLVDVNEDFENCVYPDGTKETALKALEALSAKL